MAQRLRQHNVPVYFLDLAHMLDIRVMWRLARVIREFKPDILTTYLIHADLLGRVIGRLMGVQRIVCSKRGGLLHMTWVDRFTSLLVTHWVVQTKTAGAAVEATLNVPATLITVIRNGLNASPPSASRAELRRHLGLDTRIPTLICTANLKARKGHAELLQAMAIIIRQQPVELLLAGDGPLRASLENQASELGIAAQVHFLGVRDDVPNLLFASDIFVLPTHSEGMSNALLEAMAAGLPCVTTDIPANRELITDETGLLIPVNNPDALAKTLLRLLAQPDKAARLGQAAQHQVATNYSLKHVTDQWRRLYRSLL